MSVAVDPRKKVWTEEEIQALPDGGYLHEIVDGELPGFQFPTAQLFQGWDWE